ncbi:phosphoenolpyruvate synthase [candidate division KSB1 bacterium]|nr:phosphoenolpyruvate synthase [candidate division KSB1 bacterium]
MNKTFSNLFVLIFGSLLYFLPFQFGIAQPPDALVMKQLIQDFKKDIRGPYQAIRWFCPDGTMLPPDQRCAQPGGIQHALHKEIVQTIARENRVYLGQILAGTAYEDFWGADNQNSRLTQYQIEKYLQLVDDGWIFRKARYYRGAIQAEDEENWGLRFLSWLLSQDSVLVTQFFLARQACLDIPHAANDNRLNNIRSLSKTISDSLPTFIDLRVKIHGQPDAGDFQRVQEFRLRNQGKIPLSIEQKLLTLEKELELAYQQAKLQSLSKYYTKMPSSSAIATRLKQLIDRYGSDRSGETDPQQLLRTIIKEMAEVLWTIRTDILNLKKPAERLAAIDLSNEMEALLFRNIRKWRTQTIYEVLDKNYTLSLVAASCGFLEIWEWERIKPILKVTGESRQLTLEQFRLKANQAIRTVEWCTGMVRAVYNPVVNLFYEFEPLASGFIDDKIRSSVLLNLGEVSGAFADIATRKSGISNNVMGIENQNQIRGLNPGFAMGELEVIAEPPEAIAFSPQKIYVLLRAPMDLKPVAGIATVSEGNLVSHVQLLCKNLGIPNANVSQQNLNDLLRFSGQKVFYAVSPRGTVIMKPANALTAEELALIEIKKRREEKISVPTNKLDLDQDNLISLRKIRADDSGKICGPKAANLGQLKKMFPDKVAEGIVIPFGIFRSHLDQPMSDSGVSYWQFLQATFDKTEQDKQNGKGSPKIDAFVLKRLEQLREAIRKIPFTNEFIENLREKFNNVLGAEMGKVPVFIRSDTNMEDLKDFTGAGLNLTVFNVVDEDKIFQGIRDVWASPYTERSYRWRQKFLLNPENVFPSILIIQSIDVEKSGVMITTGVLSSEPNDMTIAFNRGAGGAVEGQAAESHLLRHAGENFLISPSREPRYTILPLSGGISKNITFFNSPILVESDLYKLREIGTEIKKRLPGTPGIETSGPFDVELGFRKGDIWLFQVRPYVENKKARSSAYLQSLDPPIDANKQISLLETF